MTFDICVATYNSAKWLRGCVSALALSEYNLGQIGLYFADNASTDETSELLAGLREEYAGRFRAFEILDMQSNSGFGAASNAAAHAGSGSFVFFLNPDTEIFPTAFAELEKAINSFSENSAAFELRQFPYEHPKYYNPNTMVTSWASGACFVLRREVFEKIGGFDESIFMYAEDVELSWRIRAMGHKIRYVPAAVVHHYAYQTPGEVKPSQVAGSVAGNLTLRLKYGSESDIAWWEAYYQTEQSRLFEIPGVQPLLKAAVKRAQKQRRAYRAFYHEHIEENPVFQPRFYGLDYEFARAGAFYCSHLPGISPKFSVLVRTKGRPELLALTLRSLTRQTYKSFEVVVVEDGEVPASRDTVLGFADKLDIQYHPAGKQVGRCVAGNMAMEAATGEYLCFLDDDDYFYPEHLEVMACLIEENPACRMFVSGALEAACEPLNRHATRWKVTARTNITHKRVTFATLCYGNPFPIQAAVFHKSLPIEAGMLDAEMDAFEDWDLWLRFGMYTPIASVEKTTSYYKVPSGEKAFAQREKVMAHYRKLLYQRAANYNATVSAQDILALIYTPEKAQQYEDAGQNAIDYLTYKDKLADTAREISSSGIWRAGAVIRALPRAVAMLLGGLGRGFGGLARRSAAFADRVGPRKPDIEKKDPAELNDFIFKSRRSLSWRLVSRLKGQKPEE